jgi:hypothetical protein
MKINKSAYVSVVGEIMPLTKIMDDAEIEDFYVRHLGQMQAQMVVAHPRRLFGFQRFENWFRFKSKKGNLPIGESEADGH